MLFRSNLKLLLVNLCEDFLYKTSSNHIFFDFHGVPPYRGLGANYKPGTNNNIINYSDQPEIQSMTEHKGRPFESKELSRENSSLLDCLKKAILEKLLLEEPGLEKPRLDRPASQV